MTLLMVDPAFCLRQSTCSILFAMYTSGTVENHGKVSRPL